MPVYTVREVSGTNKPTAALEQRGLNARAVAMTSLSPLSMADYPQIAYHLYKSLLPAFMLATQKKESIPTTRPGYQILVPLAECIPMPSVPLTVQFEQSLSTPELESLKSRGAAELPGKRGAQHLYTFGAQDVNVDLLSFLLRHVKKVKEYNPVPVGSVNLSGHKQYTKMIGIITMFLKTQVYPAFDGPKDMESPEGGFYDTIPDFVTGKRKGVFGNRGGKKARHDEEVEDEEMEEEDPDDVDVTGVEGFVIGDASTQIPKAKPSTPPEFLCGTLSTMPTLPGILFPYFPDMLDVDSSFAVDVVRESFLECLGDTRSAILANFKAFKGGIGSMGQMAAGKILQHIMVGVRLAIGAQARLYLFLADGKYHGFTLHGWYFTVTIDDRQYRPVAYEDLAKEAQLIDEHAVAIAHILAKLSKLRLTEGKKPTKAVMAEGKVLAATSGGLRSFIQRFVREDDDDIEIEKLANSLAFPQRYLDLHNEANILRAVDYLLAASPPPLETPIYTRGGVLTSDDPAMSIFAMFGQEGFSFRVNGGKSQTIPPDVASDTIFKTYKGKGGKLITPKPTFVVQKKTLRLCVDDWRSFTADKVFLHKQTRDSAFRCVVFGGEGAKRFWFGLIDRIGPMVKLSVEDVAGEERELGGDGLSDVEDDYLAYL